jgi:hypothetical protein
MAKYMMVLGAHAMDHIPEDDTPDVAKAARSLQGGYRRWRVLLSA